MSPRCRVCGSSTELRVDRPRGFLERRILRLFGVRPLHCDRCGLRFRSRQSPRMSRPRPRNPSEPALSSQAQRFPTAPPADKKSAQEFLQELQEAEARIFSQAKGVSETKRAS